LALALPVTLCNLLSVYLFCFFVSRDAGRDNFF